MKGIFRGMALGAAGVLLVITVVLVCRACNKRDREIIEAWERENEVYRIEKDVRSRDSAEFLREPGVRGAAEDASAEFARKRDAALERIRGGRSD